MRIAEDASVVCSIRGNLVLIDSVAQRAGVAIGVLPLLLRRRLARVGIHAFVTLNNLSFLTDWDSL